MPKYLTASLTGIQNIKNTNNNLLAVADISNTTDPCGPGQVQIGTQKVWQCNCTFKPCDGNPCLQVVDYLSQFWNYYKQFKSDSTDFYTYMLTEPRSDILKELTYSRQAANNCSKTYSASGIETRLLSCTRVEDELVDPANSSNMLFNNKTLPGYCYGIELGKYSNSSLSYTDNWFCAQKYFSFGGGSSDGSGADGGWSEGNGADGGW